MDTSEGIMKAKAKRIQFTYLNRHYHSNNYPKNVDKYNVSMKWFFLDLEINL